MAKKRAGGSTRNNRDSESKRLGVKIFGSEKVAPGDIIVRQRGTKFHPGVNVGMGNDHTLYALVAGHVRFVRRRNLQYVNVEQFMETVQNACPEE